MKSTDPTPPASTLPRDITERTIREYSCTSYGSAGFSENPRVTECVRGEVVVAHRWYDGDDRLVQEMPLAPDGRRHGVVLEWHDESEQLSLAEPYVNGTIHGTAHQWARDGRYLGSYTLHHGTGFDIWRSTTEAGVIYVSEVHSLRDGKLHGYQWWLAEDHRLWWELPFVAGELHGIEREWTEAGTLRRDAPRYWISDQRMNKRRYVRAAAKDRSIPPFRPEDQRPTRVFPAEVQRAIEEAVGRGSGGLRRGHRGGRRSSTGSRPDTGSVIGTGSPPPPHPPTRPDR